MGQGCSICHGFMAALNSRHAAEDRADRAGHRTDFDSCSPSSSKRSAAREGSGHLKHPGEQYAVKALPLNGDFHIFDIDMYTGDNSRKNVGRYFALCKDHVDLHVTTSCFTIWRNHKKTNGFAKVIPAITAAEDEDTRVFFFDDNLEWEGKEDSSGICNLRDVRTGEFVEFYEGKNGFRRDTVARHTVVYHSCDYRNILVKANILDAMEDPEYFVKIVEQYSLPKEKLVVFMDVNSTIVCNDTVQGKDLANTLLSVMFECVEFTPREPFEFVFSGHPAIKLAKAKTLKGVVKDITANNNEAYASFWTQEQCWRLFTDLEPRGELRWSSRGEPFTLEECQKLFSEYLVTLAQVATSDGIAESWFRVFEALRGQHTVVLNSFGVDTRKVALATVPDEKRVIQVTVNYDKWDDRDMQKFAGQFEG